MGRDGEVDVSSTDAHGRRLLGLATSWFAVSDWK